MKKKKYNIYTITIVWLVIAHILANLLWIGINQVPPTWDAALHTIITNKMYTYLTSGIANFRFSEFITISDYYPPVVHTLSLLLAAIGKGNYKIISLSGTIFFSLLLIFQYLYVEKLFKNKFLSFFSALFLSFNITLYQQSKDHMLDIPLAALIMGTLYFFEKSKLLSRKSPTLLFFIFLGLAFLTKWYALAYLIIPLLFNIVPFFKQINAKKLPTIILGSLLVIILCAPWYIFNWETLVSIASETSTGELADPQVLFSKENIIFYLKLIIMFQTTFVGFMVFLASSIAALKNIKKKHIAMLLVTIVFNYIFFSFVSNKNIRYIIPLMPFVSIISAYGFSLIYKMNNSLGKIFATIFSVYLIFTYLVLSFGFPMLPKYKRAMNLPILGWTDYIYLDTYPVRMLFDRRRTYAVKIAEDIANTKPTYEKTKIFNLVDRDFLNSYTLDPMFYLGSGINLENTELVWLGHLRNYFTEAEMAHFMDIEGVNYIVVPEKQIGVIESIREFEHIQRFQQYILSGQLEGYTEISQYSLPGDDYFEPDVVHVYTKTGP